jgi:hypothetical protein
VLAQYQHRLEGKLTAAGLTDAEREYALAELQDAQSKFHDATRNLTPRQWSFRSAPGRWSPAECAEHIAVIESVVLDRVLPNALQAPADPEKRKALKYSDAAVLRLGSEPEPKLNAPEAVLPAGRWNAPEEILSNISNLRGRTEQFVKSTQEDLRNRFADHPVFGTLDLYQWILLVGAHMRRHTGQIEHEKSHQDFPEA